MSCYLMLSHSILGVPYQDPPAAALGTEAGIGMPGCWSQVAQASEFQDPIAPCGWIVASPLPMLSKALCLVASLLDTQQGPW